MSAYCKKHAGDCRFKVDRDSSSEYFTAVKSLGNAVVNCTAEDIKVTREVSLSVSSSDNLGGEITGQLSVEGQLAVNGSVTAGVNGEAAGTFKTPDQSKGPSPEASAKGSANGSGTVGGSASLRTAFQGGFKLSYAKNWTTQQTESTSYTLTVNPGDALTFGGSAAMQRVAGSIMTSGGAGAHGVVVDGPSSVNHSSFVANTHTVPGTTCKRLRPSDDGPEDPPAPGPAPAPGPERSLRAANAPGLVELPGGGLPAGSHLKSRTVLHGGRS
ncbi:hypothetical protein [Streptomyces luteolus]|uniref:Uncharacterized protein n=1 Tax=Streptomyces luteolus TaxID=3043615 RepID=A0ABT6T802_9ACTN|nr:hypothetical protein [Streptomyces sp. B-S-A12]MDI3424016.1 hypothetical protein [Streptomyces sp. B-S-A12]